MDLIQQSLIFLFARELNDANKRNAIAVYTKENQNKNDEARKKIINLFKAETGKDIDPTDVDVLKYVLWEEQGHICLYTGKQKEYQTLLDPIQSLI